MFERREWQERVPISRFLWLLLFVYQSSAASTPISNNDIISDHKYKPYASDYRQEVNHHNYNYPNSAYHGYSAASIGQKQDSESDSSSGGLSGILSSLTSSLSGTGEEGGSGGSSALSLLGSAGTAGLGGAALGGVKGLLGLKGVTAFGLGFTLLFFMVLGPVIAAGIAVPIVAIVYASIYIPAIGLMNADEMGELVLVKTFSEKMERNARSSFSHNQQLCLERLSCEVARIGRGHGLAKFIQWAADKSEMKTEIKTLKRVARAAKERDNCAKYVCDPVRSIKYLFNKR